MGLARAIKHPEQHGTLVGWEALMEVAKCMRGVKRAPGPRPSA